MYKNILRENLRIFLMLLELDEGFEKWEIELKQNNVEIGFWYGHCGSETLTIPDWRTFLNSWIPSSLNVQQTIPTQILKYSLETKISLTNRKQNFVELKHFKGNLLH